MVSLVGYEWKKAFAKKSIWIVLVLFGIINLLKIESVHIENSYLSGDSGESWNKSYWEMYQTYEGKITTKKIKSLVEIYNILENQIRDQVANTSLDNSDTMTGNVYSDYNLLERYYMTPMKYYYNYEDNAQKVALKAKENAMEYLAYGNQYEYKKNAVIFNMYKERKIQDFAYVEMYNNYMNYDFSNILVIFLCLYGIIGVFGCENTAQMNGLLITNKYGGKKTILAKICAVSIYVVGISVLFSMLNFIGFTGVFRSLEGSKLPIYALASFSEVAVDINVIEFVVVSAMIRALGFWVISMSMLLISQLIKNSMVAFVVGILVSVAMAVISNNYMYSSNIFGKIISPMALLTNVRLFEKTEFVCLYRTPILSWQAAVFSSLIFGIIMIVTIIGFAKNNYHYM